MDGLRRQFGMTLVELLVALVVVLILISATARLGRYVKIRSSILLTQSALEVLNTALQLYYDDFGAFPPVVLGRVPFGEAIGSGVSYTAGSGVLRSADWPDEADWPSAGLYYFLDRSPESRGIVEALTGSLMTNQDALETAVRVDLSPSGERKDLVRFVDPWGTSLWYWHSGGGVFPRVISAGPDKTFGTEDDIENNH